MVFIVDDVIVVDKRRDVNNSCVYKYVNSSKRL